METNINVAAFSANIAQHKKDLLELCKTYELAQLGYEVNRAEERDIANEVLAKNAFFCPTDEPRMGVKKGDRILDEECDFLISEKDKERYFSLLTAAHYAAGLCDEKGFIKTNWVTIVCNARNALFNFIVENILPIELRSIFWEKRQFVTTQEKLIEIFKKAI